MKNIRVLTADTVVKKKAYNAKRLKKKFEKKLYTYLLILLSFGRVLSV